MQGRQNNRAADGGNAPEAGAQNYHGHDYMDLQRFAENTPVHDYFDVLTRDSPVGWKGERTRLFCQIIGYQRSSGQSRQMEADQGSQPCKGQKWRFVL